jgi:hypothetical protein
LEKFVWHLPFERDQEEICKMEESQEWEGMDKGRGWLDLDPSFLSSLSSFFMFCWPFC